MTTPIDTDWLDEKMNEVLKHAALRLGKSDEALRADLIELKQAILSYIGEKYGALEKPKPQEEVGGKQVDKLSETVKPDILEHGAGMEAWENP